MANAVERDARMGQRTSDIEFLRRMRFVVWFAAVLFVTAAPIGDLPARSDAAPADPAGESSAPREKVLRNVYPARGTVRKQSAAGLHLAGRVRIVSVSDDNPKFSGEVLAFFPSDEGHPNALNPGTIAFRVDEGKPLEFEVGKVYVMVFHEAAMYLDRPTEYRVIAYADDVPEAAALVRRTMESEEVFLNDRVSRNRRALWRGLWAHHAKFDKEPIRLYCENDDATVLLFFTREGGPYFYRLKTNEFEHREILSMKALAPFEYLNRITFEDGEFKVWINNEVEIHLSP